MRRPSAKTLKASLLALALVSVASLGAAEKEKDKGGLVGLTKEQVYARLGDPRNQIKAGQREVLYFSKVKLTLRNNVVIETEEIADEAPAAPKRDAASAAASETTEPADTGKARKPVPAQPNTPPPAPAPVDAANKSGDSAEGKGTAASGFAEIKAVRPPTSTPGRSFTTPRPTTKESVTTPPVPSSTTNSTATRQPSTSPTEVAPKQVVVTAPPATTTTTPAAGLTTTPATMPTEQPAATETAPSTAAATATVEEKKDADKAEAEATKQPPPKKKRRFFRPVPEDDEGVSAADIFTTQTIIFALLAVGAVGYLFWRGRNRKLLLSVTTVSNTPFTEAAAADTGALFTADLLGKLEWKRFEELVAAYYVKTGVIAVRTKTGPESPVHLKISWKGEAKPFACVQCHSNPIGLIKPGPLHALHTELTAAEIRRGYVVTNGKFNVEARDFAEEKHFTLLPGDILLEKLNALPPPARAELLQQTTAGDYTTATCPKCDTKMHRAEEGWRCAKCDTFLPAKKV